MKRCMSVLMVLVMLSVCVPVFAGGHCAVNVAKVQVFAQPVAVPVAVQQYAAPVQTPVFQQGVVSSQVYQAPTFTVQTPVLLPVATFQSDACYGNSCAVSSGAVVQINASRGFSGANRNQAVKTKVKKVKVR